jgi:hypothetical protein
MNKKSTTSNLKILILVLSSKTYPSSRNKKAIKKTWGSNLKDNFEIMFYESGETEKIIDNTLFVETDTSSKNLGYKLLLALDWCTKNTDYDFIFRTNTSSFVNTIELENFITNNLINKDYVYCGMPLVRDYKDSDKKIKFLSGAGIILNKKTTQLILDKRKNWDHSEWEDVSLGKLLSENGVSFTEGRRQDIQYNFYNNIIDKTNYHYRCRLDNHYGYPRLLEKFVFADLNKILKTGNLNKLEIFVKKNLFYFLKIFRVDSPRFKIYRVLKFLIKVILPKQIFEYLKKGQPLFLKKFIAERI